MEDLEDICALDIDSLIEDYVDFCGYSELDANIAASHYLSYYFGDI